MLGSRAAKARAGRIAPGDRNQSPGFTLTG
jgi:hypothetical protein